MESLHFLKDPNAIEIYNFMGKFEIIFLKEVPIRYDLIDLPDIEIQSK